MCLCAPPYVSRLRFSEHVSKASTLAKIEEEEEEENVAQCLGV
jgi:hypothetical protein